MWPHLLTVATGLWLMLAPSRLALSQFPASHDYMAGPVVVALGIIACSEVTRPVRWGALIAGVWLIFAPYVLRYATSSPAAATNDVLCGGIISAVSIFRGRMRERRGGGWRALWRSEL